MGAQPISDEDLDWLRGNVEAAQSGLGNDFILRLIARVDAAQEADAKIVESLIGRHGGVVAEVLTEAAAAIRRGEPTNRSE